MNKILFTMIFINVLNVNNMEYSLLLSTENSNTYFQNCLFCAQANFHVLQISGLNFLFLNL